MKKELLGTFLIGIMLLANANASVERIGGYMGFDAIEEHNQEAVHSSEKEQEESHSQNMLGIASSIAQESYSSAKKEAHDAYSSAKSEAKDHYSSAMQNSSYASNEEIGAVHDVSDERKDKVKNILELIQETLHDKNASQNVKELAKEMKYAIEFYKKEDILADLNISDFKECNATCLKEVRQKVQQAYEERKKELKQEILKHKNRVKYKVAGYFVKIGEGQYDWAFVMPNGDIYKLAGVDASGHFKYEKQEGKAQITANGYIFLPGTTSGEGLPFINYNDPDENGFDWVIVTKDGKLYKLEGYDQENQTFVYTPVEGVVAKTQSSNEVEVLPGT